MLCLVCRGAKFSVYSKTRLDLYSVVKRAAVRYYTPKSLFVKKGKKLPKTKTVIVTKTYIKYKLVQKYVLEGSKWLFPVHVIMTFMWIALFYILGKSGYLTMEVLEEFDYTDAMLEYLSESKVGSLAISIFLMKLSAPLQYLISFVTTILITRSRVKKKRGSPGDRAKRSRIWNLFFKVFFKRKAKQK